MLFNLVFANNTISSDFFLLFINIDIYFLILATIAQIFNSTAEIAGSIGIPLKEAKAEIETHPATAEG